LICVIMLLRDTGSPFRAFRTRSALFLLAGLGLLGGVVALWGHQLGWFQRSLRVALISSSSLGLVPGTPVRVSGIHVGVIDAVELLADGKVRLDLKVDDRYRAWVTPLSRAFLARPSLLGSGGVDITPAPMEARRVPDHFFIPAQSTADLEGFLAGAATTQSDLQTLIRSTNRIAAKELPQTIQELASVLAVANKIGATVNLSLPPTVSHLQGTLRQGQQTTQLFQRELPPTLAQVRNTLGVISQTGDSAGLAVRQSQQSLEEFMLLVRRINGVVARLESMFDPAVPAEPRPSGGRRGSTLPTVPAEPQPRSDGSAVVEPLGQRSRPSPDPPEAMPPSSPKPPGR
jgi:ABC-type transporter Mla subunit MlaD